MDLKSILNESDAGSSKGAKAQREASSIDNSILNLKYKPTVMVFLKRELSCNERPDKRVKKPLTFNLSDVVWEKIRKLERKLIKDEDPLEYLAGIGFPDKGWVRTARDTKKFEPTAIHRGWYQCEEGMKTHGVSCLVHMDISAKMLEALVFSMSRVIGIFEHRKDCPTIEGDKEISTKESTKEDVTKYLETQLWDRDGEILRRNERNSRKELKWRQYEAPPGK